MFFKIRFLAQKQGSVNANTGFSLFSESVNNTPTEVPLDESSANTGESEATLSLDGGVELRLSPTGRCYHTNKWLPFDRLISLTALVGKNVFNKVDVP